MGRWSHSIFLTGLLSFSKGSILDRPRDVVKRRL
jgi:hypothetical protein